MRSTKKQPLSGVRGFALQTSPLQIVAQVALMLTIFIAV
jgi:hypothetical protein